MIERERLSPLIKRTQEDGRITPIHMSFLLALLCCWEDNGWKAPIRASRKMLMKLAKIHSSSTYHKCVQELSAFGYIDYKPSFNPRGSDFSFSDLTG
ncbi:hypothetical protein LJ707_01925 [Mucilaginibacter sp. UR6-1]|uniref:hypothetical protein n=1 Tax=Mucilaginibacter sp. UR6-1 TaxID=1435643 RepID=UPI001E58005B|nr:hypothetical protein [Mucilaginibacter sp. UR6-1]MCC8407668.1 hypothetical protein [Mucilaginibacter sp. UR6-1]